ncbi:deoxyribonuclease-2-alpha isoform X2 [Hemicordylus capensis]|uniref:deoxyribonuclease-2-alpha isoform X2 n=1 Tax=Hemicordylus capensis TaxID=884348 RepID=UPI00230203E8|nr:deoxyribonuclease-2-alpha isoform X2 [Hemicordylus capensis]
MLPILLFSVALDTVQGGISCYDDSGQPVDWFITYKLPKPHRSPVAEGMRYMYQDGRTQGWVQGRSLMNSTEGAVGRTLQQLYTEAARRQDETAYVLYNDEPPSKLLFSSKGHTKGNQLLYTEPEVYDSSVEGTFAQDFPALLNASEGQHIQEQPWNSSVTLTTLGGKEFVSFAKFRAFDDDLYSGWLAPALASDLYVEFWLRSRGILPSNCSGHFRVYNMEELAFPDPSITFHTMVDHSKWCVGTESDPGWACVGDMNRNEAEEQRGGGALCCRDAAIWKAFRNLVKKYTDCDDVRYH